MFVGHSDLLWMLRQLYGQRVNKEKLIRKFTNHGLSSLLPYFDGIGPLFDSLEDKQAVVKNVCLALGARVNQDIKIPDTDSVNLSCRELKACLLPILIQLINNEDFSTLEEGARVHVKLECEASHAKPGSEGFITEKSAGTSRVRFYSSVGRYGVDLFSMEIPDQDLELLPVNTLLDRHQNSSGIAQYFFNDSVLRSMRTQIDSSVYSFAANRAVKFLAEEGFLKIDGDEFIGVFGRIFSVLAPKLDEAYRNRSLFSSRTLSSPPSEMKPHVLHFELTTGCDYNRCTFCSEYSHMEPVTKSLAEFKAHVDQVVDFIGTEKSRIRRLFIGSGNSLGVETGLLLEALTYVSGIFNPQRISLYGRTTSILEKSTDELKRLKDAGLSLIYWGLESGSDDVLNYICKDCTRSDMIEASKMLAETGIEVSAMLMPGVGGLKLSEQHVAGTLELLHNIDIRYLTLLSINPAEQSLYEMNMRSEEDNRHLTPDEVNGQVYQLLEGLRPTGLQIGMFTEEVDEASSNTMRLNYQFTESSKDLLLRDFWN